jgi:hypothetical protein
MESRPIPFISPTPLLLVATAMLLGIVPLFRVTAMGMLYSDEVYTSWEVGGGYQVDDSVYFLMNYGLYRKPQGIARFPDGGISRYITRQVYLCRADGDASVHNLFNVMPGHNPGLSVRLAYYEVQDDLLVILFKSVHSEVGDPRGWRALGWNIHTDTPETLSDAEKEELLENRETDESRRLSIAEITELLDRATLRDLDLPSPLDHMKRSDRRYRNDLVELRGDQYYRRAIIEAIADGTIRADPEKLLQRIEKKRLSLDEPYRSLYEMRAADIIEPLEAL